MRSFLRRDGASFGVRIGIVLFLLVVVFGFACATAPRSVAGGITVVSYEADKQFPESVGVYRLASAAIGANGIGDTIKPTVTVYLPPSYTLGNRVYPVMYYLHGSGSYRDQEVADWRAALDQNFAKNPDKQFILVSVPGANKFGASLYLNSPATGNWEDYIVRELPAWVESNFRAIPDRKSRGLFGFSMGGAGGLRIAFKYPEVYSRLYAMSSGGLLFEEDVNPEYLEKMGKQWLDAFLLAAAPAMDEPPPFIWYPEFSDDPTDKAVVNSIRQNAVFSESKIQAYLKKADQLEEVVLTCGEEDGLLQVSRSVFIIIQQLGVPSKFKIVPGGHGMGQEDRIASVIPFFQKMAQEEKK